MTKKVKFQTEYEKTESSYLFLFSLLTLLLLANNAFKFSLYSLRNMNCEYEHNYATENLSNTVRECHQNCKNFLRSLTRKMLLY